MALVRGAGNDRAPALCRSLVIGSFHVHNPFSPGVLRAGLLLLGSAFVTVAAGATAPIELQPLVLTHQQRPVGAASMNSTSHSRPGGRNRLVRPAHARDKFAAEAEQVHVRFEDLPFRPRRLDL